MLKISVHLNITEIPSQAFMPFKGKQSKLHKHKTQNTITIKKMAFFNLENFHFLEFNFDVAKI